MNRYMTEVQARLLPMVGQGAVRSLIVRAPGGFGPSDDFNSGAIAIFLKPWEERSVTTAADGRAGSIASSPRSRRCAATPRSGTR